VCAYHSWYGPETCHRQYVFGRHRPLAALGRHVPVHLLQLEQGHVHRRFALHGSILNGEPPRLPSPLLLLSELRRQQLRSVDGRPPCAPEGHEKSRRRLLLDHGKQS
jgi:hypothetical protein